VDPISKYEFDRLGYLVIPELLSSAEVDSLARAVERLEQHALARVDQPPRKSATLYPHDWHQDADFGYHAITMPDSDGSTAHGQTLIVEDFFNADPAFDLLVNHPATMDYIEDIVQGPIRINNSELRFRYQGNGTGAHMGGPADHKYRYAYNGRGVDAMMVRMVYFLHDVSNEQGAFCVVPATHKTNYPSPYADKSCEEEPGMIGLEVTAGDAILFTENLRHGGLTNTSEQTRKTLHVGYGPYWMMSQNDATRDEPQYVTPATLERYDEDQRALFVIDWPQVLKAMRGG
jgi:hypothetical protein